MKLGYATPIEEKRKRGFQQGMIQGSIADVQKKYEILSDLVIVEHGGKVHGSQRDRDPKTGLIDLLVYYEVPLGQRDEIKRKYQNSVLNQNAFQRNN